MGLLDRLRKKSSSVESSASEDNEQNEIEDNQSFDDEEDLFLESDSEEELDEFDLLDVENSDDTSTENQSKLKQPKSKRWIVISLIVFTTSIVVIGAGLWYYLSNQKYPKAEELTKRFFNSLSEGKFNTAYSMMDKPYREQVNDDDFRLLLRASAYYFDKIDKVEFKEDNFEFADNVGTLTGSIEYVGKASGGFELKLISRKLGKREKLFITGFEVNSEQRRKREEKASHKAVTEFLGTFTKERANVFEGFFHPKRLEMWGLDKRLKLLKLHSRLVDIGFVEHKFKPTDFKAKSNVERVYFGKSQTKLGNQMNAMVTVFYEKGNWYVTHLDFKPQ